MKFKQLFILITTYLVFSNFIVCQTTKNVLWDKKENKSIGYATIKGNDVYAISNEDGVFEFDKTDGKITIQSVIYETLEIDYNFLIANDTIYMQPLTYELDEVLLSKESLHTQMLKTVLTDYALEPHKEEFFLRVVIRKDKELYKIIDFSGLVEKKALFDTKSKPMPKKNYKVQINNIRKAGLQGRNHDVIMFSFKKFFTYLIRLNATNKEEFNITYQSTSNNDFRKVILEPKDRTKTEHSFYYILNDDNTFKEANVSYKNKSLNYVTDGNIKYRTTHMNWKSNFDRNKETGLLQLNKGKIDAILELIVNNDIAEIYNISYHYSAKPIPMNVKIKNNINLKKDMFRLKQEYNPTYWEKLDILTLTNEMQEFINKINTMGKNSDFKTKTNMN